MIKNKYVPILSADTEQFSGAQFSVPMSHRELFHFERAGVCEGTTEAICQSQDGLSDAMFTNSSNHISSLFDVLIALRGRRRRCRFVLFQHSSSSGLVFWTTFSTLYIHTDQPWICLGPSWTTCRSHLRLAWPKRRNWPKVSVVLTIAHFFWRVVLLVELGFVNVHLNSLLTRFYFCRGWRTVQEDSRCRESKVEEVSN